MIQYRTMSQLLTNWVLPEIDKRIGEGKIKGSDLPIAVSQFRVIWRQLLDGESVNIVEVNEEVKLVAKVKLTRTVTEGELLTLDDIVPEECFIQAPTYDGKPAAYILCQSLNFDYFLCLDLEPNLVDATSEE